MKSGRPSPICGPPAARTSVQTRTSDKRQRAAIEAYAKAAGYEIADTFYDTAVSGADPVSERSGFAEMLERLMSNGARTIIVESPDRFARDLMVQLAGHDMLKAQGMTLIAALPRRSSSRIPRPPCWCARYSAPSPNSRRRRLVAKLAAARRRKRTGDRQMRGA